MIHTHIWLTLRTCYHTYYKGQCHHSTKAEIIFIKRSTLRGQVRLCHSVIQQISTKRWANLLLQSFFVNNTNTRKIVFLRNNPSPIFWAIFRTIYRKFVPFGRSAALVRAFFSTLPSSLLWKMVFSHLPHIIVRLFVCILIHLVYHQINAAFSSASCFIYKFVWYYVTPEVFAIGSTLHVLSSLCNVAEGACASNLSPQHSSTVFTNLWS